MRCIIVDVIFYIQFVWAGARHGFKHRINFPLIVFGNGSVYRLNSKHVCFEEMTYFDTDPTWPNDEANQETLHRHIHIYLQSISHKLTARYAL